MASTSGASPLKPLPPPRQPQLVTAAGHLHGCDWEVVRDAANPHTFAVRGAPEFTDELFQPLPPTSGNHQAFAWRLVVQAAAGLAARMPQAFVDAVESSLPADATAGERESALLRACRNKVCGLIEDIARNGDFEAFGRPLGPYDALLALALADHVADASGRDGGPAEAGGLQPEVAPPPRTEEKATPRGRQARRNWKAVKGRLEESAFKKGLKYVLSSAMDLRIVVASTVPLELTLMPGNGYERRFETILLGKEARSAQGAGQTVMLRALLDVVERLDAETVKRWLPGVAWDRLNDEAVEKAATGMLQEEVKRKMAKLLTDKGIAHFERYAAGAD